MVGKPPIQGVKGVNLTKGKIMLERKVMRREYDGRTAAVGDRVARRDGVEGEVVYVGENQFLVEIEKSLWIYKKGGSSKLCVMESYVEVNGFLVPAPAEEFAEDTAYIAAPAEPEFTYKFQLSRAPLSASRQLFARGLVHRSAANAIAHAKAMVGIDPYARESLDDACDERPAPPAGEGLPRAGSDAAHPTPPEGSSL